MKKKYFIWIVWIISLFLGLLLVAGLSFCIGTQGVSFKEAPSLISVDLDLISKSIFLDLRLPRILLGFAVGGALAIAGVILQGMFRNVLVEPYSLGISGGAALGVCLNLVLRLDAKIGALSFPVTGFLGAFSIIMAVYYLNSKKGILKLEGLLLTGVMISFISSSLVMLLMAIARADNLNGIIFWIMGSLDETNRQLVKIMVVVSLSGLTLTYFYSRDLNALSLGEEEARNLGVNTTHLKKIVFVLASILTGCAVSICGVIGFVGLVVPHFMRMFVGFDHRVLLVTSFLSGGIFLIACDTISRVIIYPLELPVGVVTGILGGIVFIYALAKNKKIYFGGK